MGFVDDLANMADLAKDLTSGKKKGADLADEALSSVGYGDKAEDAITVEGTSVVVVDEPPTTAATPTPIRALADKRASKVDGK